MIDLEGSLVTKEEDIFLALSQKKFHLFQTLFFLNIRSKKEGSMLGGLMVLEIKLDQG